MVTHLHKKYHLATHVNIDVRSIWSHNPEDKHGPGQARQGGYDISSASVSQFPRLGGNPLTNKDYFKKIVADERCKAVFKICAKIIDAHLEEAGHVQLVLSLICHLHANRQFSSTKKTALLHCCLLLYTVDILDMSFFKLLTD
ncbi:MAG: hypothetical protein OIF58_16545 [Cohaesibacter sp.]|nr:hypothetical protein [Cohaesibacter sp.]